VCWYMCVSAYVTDCMKGQLSCVFVYVCECLCHWLHERTIVMCVCICVSAYAYNYYSCHWWKTRTIAVCVCTSVYEYFSLQLWMREKENNVWCVRVWESAYEYYNCHCVEMGQHHVCWCMFITDCRMSVYMTVWVEVPTITSAVTDGKIGQYRVCFCKEWRLGQNCVTSAKNGDYSCHWRGCRSMACISVCLEKDDLPPTQNSTIACVYLWGCHWMLLNSCLGYRTMP